MGKNDIKKVASVIINEVTRPKISSLFIFFLWKDFTQSLKCKQTAFTHKKHKIQTSNLDSDTSMRLKRGKR